MDKRLLSSLSKGYKKQKDNKLVLLVGLPYAGKSTLAEKLNKKNYIHFWATKIRKDRSYNDDQMLDLANNVISKLLKEGYNVVFDFLNHKKVVRDNFIKIAKSLKKDYLIVFLDTPYEILIKRMKKNLSRKDEVFGRSKLKKEVIDIINSEFEKPEEDNVIQLVSEDDVNAYIDRL